MEASALSHTARPPQALLGRSPLLRLQSDEKLIALTRNGNSSAFDALVQRYQSRLLAFLRHMLASQEDAEDVLQEVFASAYNAIRGDDRPINARPWLYRIARNRALNHLRRPVPAGQDTMDVFERAAGETTADAVHRREDFRLLIADVQQLPESQRTALLLREIDALSYEQIAEAMETTVPSVKSLLVRARVGLAEAAEARLISCAEVRLALAEEAEGLVKLEASMRRHVKTCDRCEAFRAELKRTSRALAAIYPIGPLAVLHKLLWGKVAGVTSGGGVSAGGGAGASGVVGGTTFAGGSALGGGTAAGGSALGGLLGGGSLGAGGLLSAGAGALATKAAAGLVAAAVVAAGAVEVVQLTQNPRGATVASPPAELSNGGPGPGHAQAASPLAAAPAVSAEDRSGPVEAPVAEPTARAGAEPVAPTAPAAEPATDVAARDGTSGDSPPAGKDADSAVASDGSSAGPAPTPGDGGDGSGGGVSPGWTGGGGGSGGSSGAPGGGGSTPIPTPGEPTGAPGSPRTAPVVGESAAPRGY